MEEEAGDIPEWHLDIVKDRFEKYNNNPGSTVDLDSAIDDIEKEL